MSGHGAVRYGGDDLPEGRHPDVADGEQSRNGRFHPVVGDDGTALVLLEPGSGRAAVCGYRSDEHEHGGCRLFVDPARPRGP